MYHDPVVIDSTAQAHPAPGTVVDMRAGPVPPLVLLVDDNSDARSILAEILRHRGFRTEEAEDGETGIALAVSARPDVILMDHSMPGMSGLEAARRIKGDIRTRTIPIVMLTGFASSARTGEASSDCDAYIVKPSAPDEVAATLRAVVVTARSS